MSRRSARARSDAGAQRVVLLDGSDEKRGLCREPRSRRLMLALDADGQL